MTTIFDKILSGEIPCDEVFSDDKCLAFKDITPQAPTHILIIPRKPIPSLQQIKKEDQELLGHFAFCACPSSEKVLKRRWDCISLCLFCGCLSCLAPEACQ